MPAHDASSWSYPGARWWKFDFHTHTPASSDYRDPDAVTPRDWLLDFMRAGIDCVAITDHNSGEWIDRLKSAVHGLEDESHAEYRPLYLFPGAEVTASGGTHVLAIFDPSKQASDIDSLLGAVRYHGERGANKRAADTSVIEVVKQVVDLGGIAIPAHVDRDKGLWELTGNTLEPVLTSGYLFAVEVADSSASKHDLYRQHRLAWSEVLGSDSHRLSGGNGHKHPGSHYTWIKMEEPSIEGLRLALHDGERFSVQRSDVSEPVMPPPLPAHHIRAIEIADARYMGRGQAAVVRFSPWLNVLIGGRGTGKSTVLHCLRLAARRETELKNLDARSSARVTFERFAQVPRDRGAEGGLEEKTRVQWTLVRDHVDHRVHWNQDGSDADRVVEDRSNGGDWTKSSAQHVTPERFPVRIFSQGQIAELAGDNQRALLDLIDDGAGTADRADILITAKQAFNETRARLRELDRQLSRRGEVDVALEDTDRKLEAFEGADHAAALQSHRETERQRRELDRHFDVADAALGRVDEIAGQLGTEDIPADLFGADAEDDQTAVAIIEQLDSIVTTAAEELRQAAARGRQQVERLRSELRNSAWRVAVDRIREAYDQAVATLDDQGIGDPAQHAEFVQERQRLTEEVGRLIALRAQREDLAKQQEAQLRVVTQARRTVSEARIDFLAQALAQNEFVRIRLVAYGDDLRAAERSLREAINVEDDRFSADIGGSSETASGDEIINRLLEGLPQALDERQSEIERRLSTLRQQFIGACRGEVVFGGHFNKYFQLECDKSPEFLDRLLTWFPPDSLQVEHSRGGNGTDFVPIGQGSAGQRSAAMLAFLLAHGDEPLVLDQPEDDLDNQLIYSLVVRQMRENKLRRQIIAVTHNPNIVVNGDAEMLHVLDFAAGQCQVVHSGSLQGTQMRDEVCRVMEGGRDALERRYRRLETGPGNV